LMQTLGEPGVGIGGFGSFMLHICNGFPYMRIEGKRKLAHFQKAVLRVRDVWTSEDRCSPAQF
jgi:hypothetical protein